MQTQMAIELSRASQFGLEIEHYQSIATATATIVNYNGAAAPIANGFHNSEEEIKVETRFAFRWALPPFPPSPPFPLGSTNCGNCAQLAQVWLTIC